MGQVPANVTSNNEPIWSSPTPRQWGVAGRSARVAVVEDRGKIEAFLAYELTHNRVATLIGGQTTGIDGLVSSPAVSLDIRSVIRMAGLRGWRFSRVPAEQRALVPYHYRHDNYDTAIGDQPHGRLRRLLAQPV